MRIKVETAVSSLVMVWKESDDVLNSDASVPSAIPEQVALLTR